MGLSLAAGIVRGLLKRRQRVSMGRAIELRKTLEQDADFRPKRGRHYDGSR
jgi:hypothetical protein